MSSQPQWFDDGDEGIECSDSDALPSAPSSVPLQMLTPAQQRMQAAAHLAEELAVAAETVHSSPKHSKLPA